MYVLVVCQCLQISYAFSIILPEARGILQNVPFDEFPELNIYTPAQGDECKSFIVFSLAKNERITRDVEVL